MPATCLDNLVGVLEDNERISDQEWIASLDQRKTEELRFHDQHRDCDAVERLDADTFEALYGNKRFYSVVQLSTRYVEDWIAEHAPSKVVLDYACGNGMNAIQAAKAGASVAIGLDISRVSVQNAKRYAVEAGVAENTRFVQGDCENTRLPDNCIDVVICHGMLHHLDLSFAFPELRRIMKPGGVLLGVEALDYNPLIKLYRVMTPKMRTEWESAHILSLKDLQFAKRFFQVHNATYWHLSAIPAAFFHNRPGFGALLAAGNALDRVLLKLPLLRLLAWMFTFELHKPH